jgi:hypothetical protein
MSLAVRRDKSPRSPLTMIFTCRAPSRKARVSCARLTIAMGICANSPVTSSVTGLGNSESNGLSNSLGSFRSTDQTLNQISVAKQRDTSLRPRLFSR